jgi:hypothetical protein
MTGFCNAYLILTAVCSVIFLLSAIGMTIHKPRGWMEHLIGWIVCTALWPYAVCRVVVNLWEYEAGSW